MAGIVYADYELAKRAGETETTAVFQGQHVLIPERLRAVKLMQSGSERTKLTFKPDRLKELFGQLCRATAQVAHALDSATPAERASAECIGFIEAIHFDEDQSPDSDKQDYIITEWVCGGTLADKLAGGALPVREAVSIMMSVLEGLEFAHDHNLVHGDLKPTNLLLNEGGQPKIVDFGGNILGDGVPPRFNSIPYLSPEQLEAGVEIDGRADLFSLTLLFYEMLTGRRTPRLLSAAQMPSRLNPQAPAAFDDLIQQGLQGDPRQRIRTAREMRQRIQDAMGMSATPTTPSVKSVSNGYAAEAALPLAPVTAPSDSVMPPQQRVPTAQSEQNVPAGVQEVPSIQIREPEPEPVLPLPVAVPTHRVGQRRVNEVDDAEMVWMPAGLLQMGSEKKSEEKPLQNVEVSGVWIYKYPISQGQYFKFIQHMRNVRGPEAAPMRPGMFLRGDAHAKKAATGVRWEEAQEYARWAGGRLPRESEWEWSARGPEGRLYPWGNEWRDGCANVAETGLGEQTDVDRYPMGDSWCGASDLLGNVFEWCSSLYKPYPYDPTDGREDTKLPGLRVLRGGSANTPLEEVRNSARYKPANDGKTTRTGFRLVIDDAPA